MDMGIDPPLLQLGDDLDHPTHARGRLHMAEISFHRGHGQGVLLRKRPTKNLMDGADFDGIPQSGARAVSLHIIDGVRRQGAVGERLTHHQLLSQTVGRR